VNTTAEGVELTTGVTIEVHTASFRSVRGYTVVAAVLDEVAFWRSDDSVNPDREIASTRDDHSPRRPPARHLVTLCTRRVLWDAYRPHYGQDSDVLVWSAPTCAMNPAVPEAIIAAAYAEDEAAAAAEYGAQFRRDLEAFVAREALEACVVPGRHELPPVGSMEYVAFVDPSGGHRRAVPAPIRTRPLIGIHDPRRTIGLIVTPFSLSSAA
jgi:hypothetical protein